MRRQTERQTQCDHSAGNVRELIIWCTRVTIHMYTASAMKETCIAYTEYLYTLQDPHNERRLFPETLLTDWSS